MNDKLLVSLQKQMLFQPQVLLQDEFSLWPQRIDPQLDFVQLQFFLKHFDKFYLILLIIVGDLELLVFVALENKNCQNKGQTGLVTDTRRLQRKCLERTTFTEKLAYASPCTYPKAFNLTYLIY